MIATIQYFQDNKERMITKSLFGSKRDIYKSCREISPLFGIDQIRITYPNGDIVTYFKHGSLWFKQ